MHVLINTTNYDYGQARIDTVFGDYCIDSIDDDDDQINGSNSEEDDSSCDDDKLLDKRTISVSYISTTPTRINVLTILPQLLLVSKRVLVTIIQSSMLDKIIDFLKPWTHVMKRIQSFQVSSIHTHIKSSSNEKSVSLLTNALFLNVTDFYLNVEFDDEDHADQYTVPAASAAVEREFSFTDNTITQKRSKLPPDSGNDIVFNH
ncbi:unnamed protein product [Rotaria sordida]|uniref:Uncharacterized protein n=1 Tax=Rotaria sordida TaxID=392033 RepID=A0A819Q7W8_9BILA|nr:unnamed protein product [Rotaria sordida]